MSEQGEGEHSNQGRGLPRRGLLGALGAGAAGLAVGGLAGGAGGLAVGERRGRSAATTALDLSAKTYPFTGPHQAGIATEAQDRMHFAAFDMDDDATLNDLQELMQDWTEAARRMVIGGEVSAKGAFGGGENFPPDDSGEAFGLGPSGLTLTFGFGRSLFESEDGRDRFGLRSSMPESFTKLPVMTNDFLQPARSGGDLCIQACANDPQVAVHAVRNLTRMGVGKSRIRWSQLGFGRTSSTTQAQQTPRNLFGQKDGTANLRAENTADLDEHVWINSGPAWARGGSYLVARRINMTIEVWDTLQLQEQERLTGRFKHNGAPLSAGAGGDEFTPMDFTAKDARGLPLVDPNSHVARVHPDNNGGVKMLRRGYNFVDGNDAQGRLEAGLFFIAFVNDPARFARVHSNMSRDDMFVEYLKTTGSAVFLVPPGVGDTGYVGQGLLEA